jgi:hypothetical protein
MSKIITTIVALLFLMGSALHGYRLYSRLPVIIGGYDIPLWWSIPVGAGEAYGGLMLLIVALT